MAEQSSLIRIVIADDHTIVRAGLRLLIQAQPDMVVVGEAEDVASSLSAGAELKPDILLLDLGMPGGGATRVLESIRKSSPATRVLVLTMHEDLAYVRTVFALGGAGYLVKKAAHAELLNALRTVHRGKRYIHPTMADALLPDIRKATLETSVLSEREADVLRLLASGHSYLEIAARMSVSVKTVESYRSRILIKLNLRTRSELIKYALTTGILHDCVGGSM